MLLLVATLLASSPHPPRPLTRPRGCRDRGCVRSRAAGGAAAPYDFLMFAPASGVGMSGECAGTPLTVSGRMPDGTLQSGVPVLWYEDSNNAAQVFTCTKGPEFSGIVPGSVVKMDAGLPRAMRGGDGTGTIGALVEGNRTNYVTSSERIENGVEAWLAIGGGGASAPATAYGGPDPTGGTGATRVVFGATTGSQLSIMYSNHGCGNTGATTQTSIYAMNPPDAGTLGTQSFYVCFDTTGGDQCAACTSTDGTYTRCRGKMTLSDSNASFYVGNLSSVAGGNMSATNILLWGAQCESSGNGGRTMSSYIPVTGATPLQRGRDVVGVVVPFSSNPAYLSMATDVFIQNTWNETSAALSYLSNGTPDYYFGLRSGIANNNATDAGTIYAHGGTAAALQSTYNFRGLAFNHLSGFNDDTNNLLGICLNGVCNTAATSGNMSGWTPTGQGYDPVVGDGGFWTPCGDYSGTHMAWGVCRNVCLSFDRSNPCL